MKIAVTYEKKDILRLVEADLKTNGIKTKKGTELEYKGALQVQLSIETDEDAIIAGPPPAAPKDKAPIVKPASVEDEGDEVVDMSEVLNASRKNAKTGGKFPKRELGPDESFDFPK